jgi:hypothetical protein
VPEVPAYLHLAESTDCGETWERYRLLDIPTSSGYAGFAHVDGKLVIFTDTERETAIKGYFVP